MGVTVTRGCETATPDALDQLIEWRMSDPRYGERRNTIQRQWTIEARADFSDKEKNEAITEAFRRAAVHVNATMALLSDGQKPQVVCFSDDFFTGHEDIALIQQREGDTLGEAIEAHGDDVGGEAEVSDEMRQAVMNQKK